MLNEPLPLAEPLAATEPLALSELFEVEAVGAPETLFCAALLVVVLSAVLVADGDDVLLRLEELELGVDDALVSEDDEVEDGDVELYELFAVLFVLLLIFVFCVELFTEPEALSPAEPEPVVVAPYVEFVLLLGVLAVDVELL